MKYGLLSMQCSRCTKNVFTLLNKKEDRLCVASKAREAYSMYVLDLHRTKFEVRQLLTMGTTTCGSGGQMET